MEEPHSTTTPPRRRAKFWAGGGIVLATLAGLLVWGMAQPGAASQYVSPTELVGEGADGATEVRLSGTVVPGSIERQGLTTTFTVTDDRTDVVVTTDSPMPDAFKGSSEVVAIGSFDGETFAAGRVFAKCPSKFKAKV
ncbi:MAG TPA: cytochrome c maturation protein CcmE [Actinomycetota bacterium]|nr:cytochrome c maturation protein CcmE [Actinomycetota bacterium]